MKKVIILIAFLFVITFNINASTAVDTDGTYAATAMAVSNDNLILGHFDGKIRIFDPFTSTLLKTLNGHSKPVSAISADLYGKYFLSCATDGSLIFWNAKTGDIIKRIVKIGMAFRTCALSPNGKYAYASFAAAVYVWDTATWENVAIWERVDGDVYAIAISENGAYVALGGKDGKINIYSATSGDRVKQLKSGNNIIASLAFAPNSGLLIAGGYDKTARVWHVSKETIIKEFSSHTDVIKAVAAASGGKKFATASEDGAVILWDISGKSESYAPTGSLPILSLAIDPALRFIACGRGAIFQDNKYITVWFPRNRKTSRNIYAFIDACVVLSPEGYVSGSGSFAQYVSIYEYGRRYKLSQVASRYNRPDRLIITKTQGYKPR